MLGIYTISGFLPSLGIADGLTPQYLGPRRGLKSWDRKTFKRSKDQARTMFESVYNSQDPNYRDKKTKIISREL